MNGFLVVDKPGGLTSRDVVNRLQDLLPRKTKIGHAGTLDPLATGVLVLCIGAATRLTERVQDMGKTYCSRFRFGATSTTDDADGEITQRPDASLPTREAIEAALPAFVGSITQVPPVYSAIKIEGRRSYDLARKGNVADLAPRTVRVDAIRVLAYEPPFLDVEIDCGKGTYIRSLARDLGETLKCGGLVQTLRRTRIGRFRVEDGVEPESTFEAFRRRLLPLATAIEGIPQARLDADLIRRIRMGQRVPLDVKLGHTPGPLTVLDERGELVAVGTASTGDEFIFIPKNVFHEVRPAAGP